MKQRLVSVNTAVQIFLIFGRFGSDIFNRFELFLPSCPYDIDEYRFEVVLIDIQIHLG